MKMVKIFKLILLFWCLFIGIAALGGSIYMFIDPMGDATGMSSLLPYMTALPLSEALFENFIITAFLLLFIIGAPNLIAALLIFKNRKAGTLLGAAAGALLMAWTIVQFVVFPINVLFILAFLFGAVQLASGIALWVYEKKYGVYDPKKS